MKGRDRMGLFNKKRQDNDPADNDFTKISQEIKKSPKKLSQAQSLFKDDKSKRTPAADSRKKSESK